MVKNGKMENNPYNFQAIVIGVSAGGFNATHAILSSFPEDFPLPVIIVHHRMEGSGTYLAESLNANCRLTVKEADEKEEIEPGTVYIAPAGYHLLIEKNRTFSLCVDEPVCYARPSIDVLFETAAQTYMSHLIGIILTGANSDGSEGVRRIKEKGGLTIAQDPETAEAKAMPAAAIATKSIDFVMTLEEIPAFLIILLENHDEFVKET